MSKKRNSLGKNMAKCEPEPSQLCLGEVTHTDPQAWRWQVSVLF